MTIGFIGLGNMGAPMARNLVDAGFEVTGFDVSGVTLEGVGTASSAAEAAHGKDVVVTMLPNGAILESVYDAIVPASRSGALLIDCSTVDVESAKRAHAAAASAGLLSVDAPVSGGVGGATAATLTFMAGGTEEAFTAALPVLNAMGKKLVHCGDAGAGQMAKICNNMVLAISMIGVCEAFNLADKLGLSRQAMFDVVSTSSGSCWSINTYCPVPDIGPKTPADNHYQPGFAASLMLKDLKLSQSAADMVAAATPMGARATQLYQELVDGGAGDKDFSAILLKLAESPR
ncbi:MAG: 3-hydroxyisobutyrate dehydrogenase [Rhizobiales bacterium]|nr:3-hydroxyisobutyrate dehydrogenase [Hyphomicrobiales bacterium]